MTTAMRTEPRAVQVPLVELAVTEDLDAYSAVRLGWVIEDALALRPESMTIDLAGCPFIDATGIGVLLDAHRRAVRDGTTVSLRNPSPRVRRNLQLARVNQVLDIVETGGRPDSPP